MARLYTTKHRQEILRSLEIKPVDGKVTGKEAALILSWRAQKEFGVPRQYNDASVRRHVAQGNIQADPHNRKNRYPVEIVFDLNISPTRGRHTLKGHAE
jgi:hypothetical protein